MLSKSMNQERQQTEKIVRIIALKRFEQPPPGYFHLLPDRIMNRIEKGEGKSNFWENFVAAFSIRPALVYAFGLSVCGAVTAGIFYSPKSETMASATGSMPDSLWAISQPAALADGDSDAPRDLHLANWLGSTRPIMPAETASMFEASVDRPMSVSFVEVK
jgi:hypothetical protein